MKGSDELPITPEDKAQASTKGRPVKGSDTVPVLGGDGLAGLASTKGRPVKGSDLDGDPPPHLHPRLNEGPPGEGQRRRQATSDALHVVATTKGR